MRIQLACCVAALSSAAVLAAPAKQRCPRLLAALGHQLADATCFESTDLTTNNPVTTPADNSNPNLPAGAFTPATDRTVIAPDLDHKTPITMVVPGVQLQARIASDPTGQGRFLLRLPDHWNGRLVVAGASGTRSEFNGDFAWSDYVVQQGYAYASQNKGVLNLFVPALVPRAPDPQIDLPPESFLAGLRALLRRRRGAAVHAVGQLHGAGGGTRSPRRRIALRARGAPHLCGRHLERRLSSASSRRDVPHPVRRRCRLGRHVRRRRRAESLDGSSAGDPQLPRLRELRTGREEYGREEHPCGRISAGHHAPCARSVALGSLQRAVLGSDAMPVAEAPRPVLRHVRLGDRHVQLHRAPLRQRRGGQHGRLRHHRAHPPAAHHGAGTMDGLLPIDHHARAYARKVAEAQAASDDDGEDAKPAYRLYEVQNGNHIETFKVTFPQLELIEAHAQRAFDLLVDSVEHRAALPPSQCIPRGGAINASPAQPGHCSSLFVP